MFFQDLVVAFSCLETSLFKIPLPLIIQTTKTVMCDAVRSSAPFVELELEFSFGSR